MAGGEKEHRMLFDLRGRRRNVVKIVYAVLAVLMGLSLFIIGGSGSITGIFNDGGSGGGELAELAEERAERVETKLVKSPEDPNLLLNLTRARIQAAEATSSFNPETGEAVASLQTRQQYEKASEAWSRYLGATNEPSPTAAQQVARALFTLAQISRTPNEIEANMQAAADAQQIAVEKRPTASSLSNYALYKTFAFDYAEAQQAAERVKKLATSKFERENFENELEQNTETAKQFEKQLVKAKKENQGGGKEQLEAPVPGFGGGAVLGE